MPRLRVVSYNIHCGIGWDGRFNEQRILEGMTDQEGRVQHADIPPGDYRLEIEGHTTFVPATPFFRDVFRSRASNLSRNPEGVAPRSGLGTAQSILNEWQRRSPVPILWSTCDGAQLVLVKECALEPLSYGLHDLLRVHAC